MTSLVTPSGRADVELKVFVQTDGGDRCRVEIGFGQGDRRNRHLICGVGFIVVDGVAGIGQRADAHAGLAAVNTDHAGAVERSCAAGKRGPICLNGVVQHLVGLHDGINTHVKGETDSSTGINIVGGIPAKNRLVGTQGRGVDIVRRIAAAQIADVGQVQPIQVVQHSQVICIGCAGIGSGDGHRQDIGGIGIGHGKRLGQFDVRFAHQDIDLSEIEHYRVAGFVDIPRSRLCRRITVGNHISVVGDGGVFHTADEPDLEIVTIADRAVGHALIAEIPFHKVVGTRRRYGAAGNEICR